MPDSVKTPNKRPSKPFRGVIDGKSFTPENQPTPEAKKEGWVEFRKKRHLTQAIISHLGTGNNFKDFIASVIDNASKGNPKALDIIAKCLEDDIIKIAQTDIEGNNVIPPIINVYTGNAPKFASSEDDIAD